MDDVSVGIIGLGSHGTRYLNHIMNDIDGMRVRYVCRRSRIFEIMKKHKVSIETDYNQILEKDLDAVIITTPTGSHFEMAIKAMERGLNVLVEKPMAPTADQCQRMIDSSKENNVKLMVAQTLRYNPTILRLKELIDKIETISMEQHLEPPNRKWLFNKKLAGGGVLLNTGVHIFDTIRFLTGQEIIPEKCTTRQIKNPNLDDLAFGSFSLSKTGKGSFCTSRFNNTRRREISINNGSIFADALREVILKPDIEEIKGEKRTIIPLLNDFRDSIRNDLPIKITGEDGMAAVEACEEFYRVRK